MIKLIIYDLDGTLIDSSKDISNSINWMLKELGLPELSERLIRSHVGSGVVHLIQNVLNEVSRDHQIDQTGIFDQALHLYRTRYSGHLLDETQLYPGVKTVLEFFKRKKQAIITNKTEEFSHRILKGLEIDLYFFEVIGSDQTFPKKPAPDSVLKLIHSAGVNQNETVFIGDSAIDVQTGKNAKTRTIAVTYGFNSRQEIESSRPDYIVNQLNEVMALDLMKLSTSH